MKKVASSVVKSISQQTGFIGGLKENLQSLEDKWKDLEAMKRDLERTIKVAEETGPTTLDVRARLWLEHTQNIEEKMKKIQVQGAQKIQNKYKINGDVKKMLGEVEDLLSEGHCSDRYVPEKLPHNQVPLVPLASSMVFELSPVTFTYEELKLATKGFLESNFLGQGGFGPVHKGILPSEQTVAIKQQKSGSNQGMQEFQTEVNVISRVHHKHLVSLVGYCIAQAQMTLMLVYEFVPNKTLDFHLHGKGAETLDWSTRMKIANGSAKGLAYLHEDCIPKVIHRDIKAANILLDNNFEPKIADFGLAKLSSNTDTHVFTAKLKGTFGYFAPEYAYSGKLSEKADVFSFGVVLLELITGQKPVLPDDSLVEWARPLLSAALGNRKFEGLADRRLQNNYDSEEMFRMASCAANCVRRLPVHRPRMSQVVDALTGKITLDNWNEESTQMDIQDLNKFLKQSQGECKEPTSSSLENTTEDSFYSASG
ncbi:hypothetical protein K1719_045998 [Acacia pycnantha]|nr:hypothetical protein K1719_045998 [Acacia pycnantha]